MTEAVVIAVRVTPRSSRDAIEGVDGSGALRVRVTAPPADGAANGAVVKLVARDAGLPRGAVTVASGASSRHKQLRLDGATAAEVRRHWPGVRARER